MKPKSNRAPDRIDLLQGTLDMLILQTLVWGPQHGYAITHSIRGRSGEVLQVETGSLYPALHRLEKQGWVTSQWKQSESNQRAKYYRLTPAGRKQLLTEQARWEQIVSAIAGIMKPEF
jgi:PadR family transcriptional regulator PadR